MSEREDVRPSGFQDFGTLGFLECRMLHRYYWQGGFMINRRDALSSLALLVPFIAATEAAGQQAPSNARVVFKHDLPNLTMDDWEVTVNHVDYAPGRVGT